MTDYSIPCVLFKQRDSVGSPTFAVFASSASDVLKWAAIRRRENDPGGPQRRLNRSKINAIKRFLEQDERNTVPPAITLTLKINEEDISEISADYPSLRVLQFSVDDEIADAEKPGLVIDGQHRLVGLEAFNANAMVNVVALLNVDDMEKAFQFLVINNKATRVSSDLIRTLALDYDEEQLAERLRGARLAVDENLLFVGIVDREPNSPFYGHISLHVGGEDAGQRIVAPSAIENSIAVIQRQNLKELDGTDSLCEFFYGIWEPIKLEWPELWNAESKLTHKAGIVAMTKFISEAIIAKYDWDELDVTDPDAVRATTGRLLATQSPDFWNSEWTTPLSDTKAVRLKIVESLTKISRNMRADRPWHDDIDLVVL